MNTKAKAGQEASGRSQQRTADYPAGNYDSSKEKLAADLKILVADAEKMIKEAVDSSADGFATVRARFESKLTEARAKIDRAGAAVREKTRVATDATHAYVKAHPWKSAGIFAVAGAVIGLVLGRKRVNK